jgi:YcxB-like protein
MSDEILTCRFTFTAREYERSMRCWWRYSWTKWFVLSVGIFLLYSELTESSNDTPTPQLTALSVIEAFVPLLFVSAFVVFLMYLVFWRSAYYQKEITYTLRESGVHVHSPLAETELKWGIYARATETRHGFALFQLGKRSFNWVPKQGFADPDDIDRCRELIRKNVKDSRRLYAS